MQAEEDTLCMHYNLFYMRDLSCLQYYRARYESEGYRGPLKGQHECYPSVRVNGYIINCSKPLPLSASTHFFSCTLM